MKILTPQKILILNYTFYYENNYSFAYSVLRISYVLVLHLMLKLESEEYKKSIILNRYQQSQNTY